jgi:hypothetical protein
MKSITLKELRQLAKAYGTYCKSENFDINDADYKCYWEALSNIRCEILRRKISKV